MLTKSKLVVYSCTFLLALLAAAHRLKPSDFEHRFYQESLKLVQDNTLVLTIVLAGSILVFTIFGEIRETHKLRLKAYRAILDHMKARIFSGELSNDIETRITLMKCKKRYIFWGKKYLAIFARSGKHDDSRITFFVDDNEEKLCQGVAGQAYYHEAWQVRDLPEYPAVETPEALATYAQAGHLCVDKMKCVKMKARCIGGIIIRSGTERSKWGVLVIDSSSEQCLKRDNSMRKKVAGYAELIGRVL